jgi:hypothetical protein
MSVLLPVVEGHKDVSRAATAGVATTRQSANVLCTEDPALRKQSAEANATGTVELLQHVLGLLAFGSRE